MVSALMVSHYKSFFEKIECVLVENNIKTDWNETGAKALSTIMAKPIDLIIIDEKLPDIAGKELVKKVISKKPMINCVVASPLIKKEFHKAYEGFGVLMQFPVISGKKEAQKLLERLKHILDLQTQTIGIAGE